MHKINSPAIPILMYHSLDDSRSVTSTAPCIFKRQMEFLKQNGYRSLSLSEVVDTLAEKRMFPEKSFALTFDDGYRSVYTHAFPVMQEYGFTATVFLITDFCDGNNHVIDRSSLIDGLPLLSWNDVREMNKSGIEFGAHTLSHPDLTRISFNHAERQIVHSKMNIEDRLGTPVPFLAYPYGKYNSEVAEISKKHFVGACSTKLGKIKAGCDPYVLRRIEMYYFLNDNVFKKLFTDSIDLYLQAKHIVRAIRSMMFI